MAQRLSLAFRTAERGIGIVGFTGGGSSIETVLGRWTVAEFAVRPVLDGDESLRRVAWIHLLAWTSF